MIIPTGFVFRGRWPALGAALVLLAVVLTAGTLFAANARQHPETQSPPQQSVADAADSGLPGTPPARIFIQPNHNGEEAADLPPIVKAPPEHPNLDSNLNRLVEEAETLAPQDPGQRPNTTDNAGGTSAPSGEPVLVTFYIEPEQVAAVRQFLEDNDVFVRNVGED